MLNNIKNHAVIETLKRGLDKISAHTNFTAGIVSSNRENISTKFIRDGLANVIH